MDTLYSAADPIEAEILRSYLQSHGIEVDVFGSPLWGARGELPSDAYPRLILQDSRDHDRARALLHEYERRRHAHGHWRCGCGESSPVTFESCWSCGIDRPR
ncbi:MAG TPA: DUF2007 domain-containing protein [Fontimonas sp.]